MHQILGHCLCSIGLYYLCLAKARARHSRHAILVYFKDIFNKYFLKNKFVFFHAKFNVYRYLSILVNFLDKVQRHGVYSYPKGGLPIMAPE
jgi:hypothetical protein